MKKLHLKRWVKLALVLLFVILLSKCAAEYSKQQMINCVEGGNTLKFCQYHLGK